MILIEMNSPNEGMFSLLWSVLSIAPYGASLLMAHGPLPLLLVCISFPVGRGLLGFSWGQVNPLSLGAIAVPTCYPSPAMLTHCRALLGW